MIDIVTPILFGLGIAAAFTFDGQRYHAPGPPRKPKEETDEIIG